MLSELAFAYDSLPPGLPIAAVTGTNGKSTVATFAGQVMMTWQVLTWNILESIRIHTFVGGNLDGNLGAPLSLAVAASSHLLTLHAPFVFPAQILESIGIHTFVGGNLGAPLSLAVAASSHLLTLHAPFVFPAQILESIGIHTFVGSNLGAPLSLAVAASSHLLTLHAPFVFPAQILESIGIHTFVGGNLGAPLSLAVAASSHLLTLHAPFVFPAQILESIGIHTFVGGNLGAPLSLAVAASSHLLTLHAPFVFPAQILESIGIHTFVGGNLGTPLSLAALEFVTSSQRGHTGSSKPFQARVVEVSSYQLDCCPPAHLCLHFPLLLTITPVRPCCPYLRPSRAHCFPPVQAAVVEVSSYQMELPGRFCPKAAVILNLTPDHLERHGSMESYGAAKCRLFAHMGESDVAIIPSGDPLLMQLAGEAGGHPSMAWLGQLPGCTVNHAERTALLQLPLSRTSNGADSSREGKESSRGHGSSTGDHSRVLALDLSALQAVGRHNAENAAVAALLCLALGMENSGVRLEGVQRAVKVLQPPPHRMELVVVDGQDRAWINDSKATNVEASTAGIEGLGDESTAVILLGGIAKVLKFLAATDEGGASDASPLGFSKLVPVLNRHRAVITFGQSGPSIANELSAACLSVTLIQCTTMQQAMHVAAETALP
ncbi:unnamed protein product, partial [Closterium sp. Naga37s-1]